MAIILSEDQRAILSKAGFRAGVLPTMIRFGQRRPSTFLLHHKTPCHFLAPKYGWDIVQKRY